jgi:hypothetical protein
MDVSEWVSRVSSFASETRLVDLRFQPFTVIASQASNGGVNLAFCPTTTRQSAKGKPLTPATRCPIPEPSRLDLHIGNRSTSFHI